MKSFAFIVSVILFCISPAQADELDGVLGGFNDNESITDFTNDENSIQTDIADEIASDWTGSFDLSASYNYREHYSSSGTNYKGLQKLRTRINIQHDYNINDKWRSRVSGYSFYDWAYSINGRDKYTDEVLDDYEKETEIQELWILGKLAPDIDIKLGRQIVNWGRSDSLRVLDFINPLDNRELGLADIEDIRLPTTMIKGDLYFGEWNLSLISIIESRFSKNPPRGSDFESLSNPDVPENNVTVKEDKPARFGDGSWAAGLTGIFSGWDVSFHFARFWRDTPYLEPALSGEISQSRLKHSRVTMLGAGGNYTKGSWLFKYELAFLDDIDYTTYVTKQVSPNETVSIPSGSVKKRRTDTLVGIEYYGFTNTTLSLELVNRHISHYEISMKPAYVNRDSNEIAARFTRSFLNDLLDINVVIFGGFNNGGGVARFDAEYELDDGLSLSGGIIYYQEGDPPPFNTIKKNDRIFSKLKYSF